MSGESVTWISVCQPPREAEMKKKKKKKTENQNIEAIGNDENRSKAQRFLHNLG